MYHTTHVYCNWGKWDNLWYSHLEETSLAALSFGMNFVSKNIANEILAFLIPFYRKKRHIVILEQRKCHLLQIVNSIPNSCWFIIAKVCNFHTKKARFDSPRRNSPRNKRLGELPQKFLKRSSKDIVLWTWLKFLVTPNKLKTNCRTANQLWLMLDFLAPKLVPRLKAKFSYYILIIYLKKK